MKKKNKMQSTSFGKWNELLFSYGADVNLDDSSGTMELFRFVREGLVESLQSELVHISGSINDIIMDSGSTLLHEAARCGQFEVAKTLLMDFGAEVNARNTLTGDTCLHYLLRRKPAPELRMLQLFLEFKADPRIANNAGEASTFEAVRICSPSNAEVLQPLLDLHPPKTARSLHGLPLLHAARDRQTVMTLLANGSEVNALGSRDETALHCLAETSVRTGDCAGAAEAAELLLDRGIDADARDWAGQTALINAVRVNNLEIAKLLLGREGALQRVNDANPWGGKTPLHKACMMFRLEMIKLLMANNANVDALDDRARKPLSLLLRRILKDLKHNLISSSKMPILKFYFKYGDLRMDLAELFHYRIEDNFVFDEPLWQSVALAKARGLPIDPSFYDDKIIVSSDPEYFQKCLDELEKAKSTKIHDSWVTYFNFLADNKRKLKNYAGNDGLIRSFKNTDFKKMFSIYGAEMQKNMEKGIRRRYLFDESADFLSTCLPIFRPTHLVVRDVLDCVSSKELFKLCENL